MARPISVLEMKKMAEQRLGQTCDSNEVSEIYKFFESNKNPFMKEFLNFRAVGESFSPFGECSSNVYIRIDKASVDKLELENSKVLYMLESGEVFENVEEYMEKAPAGESLIRITIGDKPSDYAQDLATIVEKFKRLAMRTRTPIKLFTDDKRQEEADFNASIFANGNASVKGLEDVEDDGADRFYFSFMRVLGRFKGRKLEDIDKLNYKFAI